MPSVNLRMIAVVVAALGLAACTGNDSLSPEDLHTLPVRLPNGTTIRVEKAMDEVEIARGLRYRKTLEPDHGMLIIRGQDGFYPFWNFRINLRLDILWLDQRHKIVQLIHNTPPCHGERETCMQYGGAFPARYMLELPAGTAKRHGLKPGMTLDF